MRRMLSIFVMSVAGIVAGEFQWTAEDRAWEAQQAAMWEENLLKARTLEPNEKFETLALGLRNMGHRSQIPGHSPAIASIYSKLQNEFISTPGHAMYFRDRIEEAKRKVREGDMRLFDWGSDIPLVFETLGHMPSEETVEVLAGYLEDRFADPYSDRPEDKDIPGLRPSSPLEPHFDFLRGYAAAKLDALGIEDAPPRPSVSGPPSPWIAWWKEVREGKRKYRFKGSDVWHPVAAAAKPSGGTPRAGPGPAPDPARSHPPGENTAAPGSPPAGKSPAGKSPDPWLWPTIAAFAAVFVTLGYLLLRRPAA